MRNTTGVRAFLLPLFVIVGAAAPITVDTKSLLVSVDAATCRWSAEVKGTPMRLNHVHFLPGDDPSGWTVVSSVNQDDSNKSGSFVTVTLRCKKAGQLDFEYQISVSKTSNDILVNLGRSNDAWLGALRREDQPGGPFLQSRLLRPLFRDKFEHAQDVRSKSGGSG